MDRTDLARRQGELLEQAVWNDAVPRLGDLPLPVCAVLAAVSDEGLVLAIQKGFLVREAFEELLENRCKKLLFRWSFHWDLTVPDAEDLTHDLFARFLRTRFVSYEPRGKDTPNFRSYLYTTARNQRLQNLRRKKPGFLEGRPEPSANGHSAEELVLGQELQEHLDRALAQLPDPDQRVMRATLEGRTLAEIVRELGLGYPAVSMRLFRARNALEQALGLPQRSRVARGLP